MATLNVAAFQRPAPPKSEPSPDKPDWASLEVNTLSPDLQEAYYAYRKAQDAANKLRLAFESRMTDKVELPDHLRLAFAYKFGKVSVAIVKAERPRKAGLSLEDLLRRADKA